MKRSRRMQSVLEVANLKSQQGLQAVVYLRTKVAEEVEKLQQLISYQQEYQTSLSASGKPSWSVQSMLSYRNFCDSVGLAIEQQRSQVRQVEMQLEQVQESWKKLDARCQSLSKTKTRLEKIETNEADRLEQKNLDEMSMRQYYHAGLNKITRQ